MASWGQQSLGPSLTEEKQRLAILDTTEIPAASVDLSQFNFTDLVNGMLSMALRSTKKFFSFLSVTSYSSFAFHKVSILIYNISNLKYVDYHKFPMRYCYCLNNRTNDLADYTLLLLDIIGNYTSSLKELFKSTSIVSVSQSNESDCIYFCVMTGRTGRNLSDLWDLTRKPPVVNLTFPPNISSALDLESILPNLITSAENTEIIKNVPVELWTAKTSTSSSIDEGLPGVRTVTGHHTSQGPFDLGSTRKKPLEESETLLGKQNYSVFTTEELLRFQTVPPTKLPPVIPGVASKEDKISPTKSPSSVDTIAHKADPQPSDKLSLRPHNTLKDHSVLFLSHKAQNGSSLKVPGWTTIAALEMLQRPFTMMPLWTGSGLQHENMSATTRMTVPSGQDPQTQTGPSRRASSMDVPTGSIDARHTVGSTWMTSPSHRGISVEMTPLRADSDFSDKHKVVTTRKPTQITNGKKHPIRPVTLPLMQVLIPQIRPTVESPRISLIAYTKSRCRQTKLEVTLPSITSVVPKVSSCIMELCRFYQHCLCTNQELYSRYKKQRQCIQFYSWYLKNATYICEKLQRKPNRHTLKQKCLANICRSI
ncbi:HERV-H LTR-associating protein 1 [Dendropsophus ebraccatus]|uniref:HERV-H LTR-associating protein 1 n=1 Tax=Dendropsophus ebraccatus TaxID=150705 RepID=UPI0038319B3C